MIHEILIAISKQAELYNTNYQNDTDNDMMIKTLYAINVLADLYEDKEYVFYISTLSCGLICTVEVYYDGRIFAYKDIIERR